MKSRSSELPAEWFAAYNPNRRNDERRSRKRSTDYSNNMNNNVYNKFSDFDNENNFMEGYSGTLRASEAGILCLSCGDIADTCASCSRKFIDDAILDYRKAKAKGAEQLWLSALKRSGGNHSIQMLIFRIWSNSVKKSQKILSLQKKKINEMR